MVCHSFALFVVFLAVVCSVQVQSSPVVSEKRGICATEEPDTVFLNALERVRIDESRPREAGSESREGPIEIETWFHIIASKAERDQVSDDMIDSQVSPIASFSPLIACHELLLICWLRSLFSKMHTKMPVSNIACKASPTT